MRVVSTTGCGFFPWWPVEPSLPEGAPITLTLIEAMRWFWRVRTWTVDYDFELTTTDPGTYEASGSHTGNILNEDTNAILTRESDMTIGGYINCGALFTFNKTSGAGPATADASMIFLMFQFAINSGVAGSEDAWRPHLLIDIDTTVGGYNLGNSPVGGGVDGTAEIDGESVALYGNGITGNLTATPDTFWPYDERSLANPIYNSASGAQLLDPFAFDASP